MHKKHVFTLLALLILFSFIPANKIYAADTTYKVIISDDANLLTESEELSLREIMTSLSEYGNVAFKSIEYNSSSTGSYADRYYHSIFGTQSGTLFLIDMDNRNIWIFSDGYMYSVITKGYADTITDNVYKYASNGDYYSCAYNAYSQELSLLGGQRIAQPMKYIGNALIALTLGLLINYALVKLNNGTGTPDRKEVLSSIHVDTKVDTPNAKFVKTTKTYSPQSSSSSGGGGGGGGSSGGGGGHSF